jgi:hypothetical protein
MPATLPDLQLTHGQLLWALSLGHEPSKEVQDKIRYLRQIGIPRPKAESVGRGYHITYGFDDLVLVGFGMLGLSEGFKPRALVKYLVEQRSAVLDIIREVWTLLPENLLELPWVRSRGQRKDERLEPFYLRLHGRARGAMAGIELVKGEGNEASPHLIPYETIPGEAPAKLFEIDYWVPQWVAWACDAPNLPRGPKPSTANS